MRRCTANGVEAIFHQFVCDGATVKALVEHADGSVSVIPVCSLRFMVTDNSLEGALDKFKAIADNVVPSKETNMYAKWVLNEALRSFTQMCEDITIAVTRRQA